MNKFNPYTLTAALALLPTTSVLAAEGGADANPMKLYYMEMVWAVVLFLLFAGILGFVVWPKILGALQAREAKLEGDLVGAENAREEADKTLAEYKAQLADAQKAAQQKIADAVKVADQQAAKIVAEAEAKAAEISQRNLAEIESAKEAAISEMHAHVADLSTQIAGKILQREISAADQQQLVSESLAELGKSGV